MKHTPECAWQQLRCELNHWRRASPDGLDWLEEFHDCGQSRAPIRPQRARRPVEQTAPAGPGARAGR